MSEAPPGSTDGLSESVVTQETIFGRMPLRLSEREYGTWGAHNTNFAYAIATWCFLTGGYTAQLVGAVPGMVCLIAGSLIGVFLTTMPLSLGCQRWGLEQMDFCKPPFGQRGARIILVFYLINMIGWSGLILVMFGNGIRNIVETFGYEPGGWVVGAGVALGIVLSYLLTTRGVHLLNLLNTFITPGLGILVAFMFYMLLSTHGWAEITAAPPLDPFPVPIVNYAIAIELGIASGISWWGGIGFLARNTRTRRNAVYPEILQLGISFGVVCSIALFSGLVVQSDDPTEWMVPIGGVMMGVLALAFVALANVTSTAVSLYASGLALRHVPGLRSRPWWQLIFLTIVPCIAFVFWPVELSNAGDIFLAYNGTMYAPISGIAFVDYFFLRGQKLDLWSIFDDAPDGAYHYWRGYNVLALGSIALGQGVYLFLYNPLTAETHDLFRFVPASAAACLVPALVYWIGMRWLRLGERSLRSRRAPQGERRRLVAPNI